MAMIKLMRNQSKVVLGLILAFLALGFLFYGNSGQFITGGANQSSSDFGRIEGQDLTYAEFLAAERTTRQTAAILGGHPNPREIAEETWAELLLANKARQLHIDVSDDELADFIRSMPTFQDPATHLYSPTLRQDMMSKLQANLQISPSQFEAAVRQFLVLQAVQGVLFASVRTAQGEIALAYQKFYGSVELSTVSFSAASLVPPPVVSPAEVAAEYKGDPQNFRYRTDELRRVDYVRLALSPAQIKLPDKAKAAAKEALGQKLFDFLASLQPDPTAAGSAAAPVPDFLSEAKKQNLEPKTTDLFAVGTPPAGLAPSPTFNNTAFALKADQPLSKVIDLGDAVAILHLAEIKANELKPLDQVKNQIEQQLLETKAQAATAVAAQQAAKALKAAVAKGTDFKSAAGALHLAVTDLPPLVPADAASQSEKMKSLAYVASGLPVGQVSEPVPIDSDHAIVVLYLKARAQADPAGLTAFEKSFRERSDNQLREVVKADWIAWQDKKSGIRRPTDLESLGAMQ